MIHKHVITLFGLMAGCGMVYGVYYITPADTAANTVTYSAESPTETVLQTTNEQVATDDAPDPLEILAQTLIETADEELAEDESGIRPPATPITQATGASDAFDVPFFSQFNDISAPGWQKIGCGIASLAMLIEFYEPGEVSVDALLDEGIASGAYLDNAGWIHQGLVRLAESHGLTGTTHDLSSTDKSTAFAELKEALEDGPVIASVHYTFEPTNPIPHLVVISGATDEEVYFNDPSHTSGGGFISTEKFLSAWKKRYIDIRPTT